METKHYFPVRLILTAACILASWSAFALEATYPPGSNFNLIVWKITLPDQTEVLEQALSSGFESPDEFYTDPVTGGMVFKCPNNGATGGSSYPRSELREMLRAGNTSISTTGLNSNNWVFSSSSLANRQAAGGVDGTMTATLTVDYVSTNGSSSVVGRVIVGQIHASVNEPCRLYYRKLPGNSKGAIYFAHEPNTGTEKWYEMIGSRSDSASNPADGIALGETFSYEIKAVGNTLSVTIMRDGKPNVTTNVDISASGYANDWMYFKAGVYNQNNEGDGTNDYAQAAFYALAVNHGPYSSSNTPAITTQPASQTVTTGSNVTFTVGASGTAPLAYQWYFNTNTLLSGQTGASLTLSNVQSNNAGSYRVVVTNLFGSVTSAVAALTVIPPDMPPSITSPPANQTVIEGQNATFTVTAAGAATLSYQWRYNTNSILTNGASSSFTVTSAQTTNAGTYHVIVTNAFGSATSSVAVLTVNAAPPVNTNAFSWDATTGTAGVQDGAGTWSPTNANWLLDGTNLVWNNSGQKDAIFGGGLSGTAGNVTIPTGTNIYVRNITFNAPKAGSYTIAAKTATNSVLSFSGAPAVTVASSVTGKISTIISGTGFTKEGGGTLSLTGSTNNTFSGLVTVNGGTLIVYKDSDDIECIPAGGIQVNTGATLRLPKKNQIHDAATVTCAGGTVEFVSSGGDTIASLVLDGGTVTNSDTGTARVLTATTAIDVRSGQVTGNAAKTMGLAGAAGLTKTTAGTVILGPNIASTYSGDTVINAGTLALSGSSSIASSPNITIAGGAAFDVSALTTPLTLGNSQTLTASGATSAGTIATASGKGLTLGPRSALKFSAFDGTSAPLTITGAGTVVLAAGNVVTVTVANGGTPLGGNDYKLISKGSGGGVAGVAPSSVTVNGDGIVSGAVASLVINNGELFLHVVSNNIDVSETLTVNSGNGDGSYTNGARVPITADAPASGQVFDRWTGDTQYVDSVSSASTTVTMPAQAVVLTATYKDAAVYHLLTTSVETNGAVSPASTNILAGNSATFVITADNYYRIATLTTNGTAVAGMTFDNNSMSTNFTWSNVQTTGVIAATFTAQVTTEAPADVPYEWMAQYGLTNSGATFDQAAAGDTDSDGLSAWQEYIAGTNPTNTASCLKATQTTFNKVGWSSVTGRVYSVYWSTNLMNGFQPLETNILYPQSSYTNATPDSRVNHYQIKVRLQ